MEDSSQKESHGVSEAYEGSDGKVKALYAISTPDSFKGVLDMTGHSGTEFLSSGSPDSLQPCTLQQA